MATIYAAVPKIGIVRIRDIIGPDEDRLELSHGRCSKREQDENQPPCNPTAHLIQIPGGEYVAKPCLVGLEQLPTDDDKLMISP